MDTSSLRPVSPARSWLLGVRVAAATTVVLGVSLAVDGARTWVGYGLVAASGLIALFAWSPVGRRMVTTRRGWLWLYLWPALGMLALLVLMRLLDRGPLPFVGVLTIAAVASAGSFPRRSALVYAVLAVLVGAVAWVSASTSSDAVHASSAAFLTGVIVVGAVSATARLARSMRAAQEERERAEARNRLLAVAGRTVSLDVSGVADQIVEATAELGFDMAAVSLVVGEYRIHVATRGIPDASLHPVKLEEGLAGRALTTGKPVLVEDYGLSDVRVDDRTGIGSSVAVPIGEPGRFLGALVAAKHATGPTAEEDVAVLEVLAEHAGHAIANAYRYRDEQQIVDRLRDLDTLKRSLVSNVTHDLRTPLASVHGIAETLLTRADELDPGVAERLLDRIGDNVARLSEMVHQLLDLRGSVRSEASTSIELSSVVEACLWRLSPLLAEHPVDVDVPVGLAAESTIPLLDHVLENLLTNAAKYTPAGSPITVRATPEGERIRVSVEDRGPGIPPEDLDQVTMKFWRADIHRSQPGTGLGLSLVEAMLADHGSRLGVSSVLGEGTTFSFELPAARPAGVPT